MEILLDAGETRTLREAARYASSNADTIALEVDLYIVFSVEQRRRIEQRLDDANLFRFLRDLVAAWNRRDPDDLLALVVTCLGNLNVRLSLTHQVEAVMEEAWRGHSRHPGRVASAAS